MNITIKKLTYELVDEYLHFFDITPHSERPDEDDCKCYCVWWCNDNQDDTTFNLYLKTKELRRDYAKRMVFLGKIQGYLAYDDNKVVGWCNANKKIDCYNCFCFRNFMKQISRDQTDEKTKSIFCFAISPEYRGKGIATQLLNEVCLDAKKSGYQHVEAYPNIALQDQAKEYMGPLNMYLKTGFKEIYSTDDKLVLRKEL